MLLAELTKRPLSLQEECLLARLLERNIHPTSICFCADTAQRLSDAWDRVNLLPQVWREKACQQLFDPKDVSLGSSRKKSA